MTRKAILNTTSRKKRNGMLSFTSTATSGGGLNLAPYLGAAYVNASTNGMFLWNATAQSLDAQSVIPNQASRTATTCYMRGLSEHLRVSTNSGIPWFHRRICFTTKSPFQNTDTSGTLVRPTYLESSAGVQRLWFNATNNANSSDVNEIYGRVFRGQNGLDWNDALIAPTDPTRISVKFDRTWVYKSGNQVGTHKERKVYHAMNKNIVYDDDESGDAELQSYNSTQAKPGMGNYFVMDIIQALQGGTSSDILRIDSNATLYWHER